MGLVGGDEPTGTGAAVNSKVRRTVCGKGLHDLTVTDEHGELVNVITKSNSDRQCRPCLIEAKRVALARYREIHPARIKKIDRDDCEVESCDRARRAGGGGRDRYCVAHGHRWRRYGDVFEDVPISSAGGSLNMHERRAVLQEQKA